MSITKKFLKSKPICKVTFKLSKDQVNGAESVNIVGDFNEWDKTASAMKALKNGGFSATMDLDQGKEYQFRYLLDGQNWMNDEEADKMAATPFNDAQNSVIEL